MLISGINNLGNVTLLRDGERLESSGDRELEHPKREGK